ncbi:MAG: hypothetical protein NC452_06030 [Eubacterium sp.]|nr:hypothetical protein [Eubacterium sp.]
MDTKNGKQISISFRVDEGVVEHNNRDFIAKNVDKERIGDNIVYRREDLREFYQKLFGKAFVIITQVKNICTSAYPIITSISRTVSKKCSRKLSYNLEIWRACSRQTHASQTVNHKPKKFGRH